MSKVSEERKIREQARQRRRTLENRERRAESVFIRSEVGWDDSHLLFLEEDDSLQEVICSQGIRFD